jgi:hypothetical protein
VCSCPRDQLCELCFQGSWDNLRGVAATRGEVWAMEPARRVRLDQPWPDGSPRVAAIASEKVADLARDPRLRDALADELARWASRWWRGARREARLARA